MAAAYAAPLNQIKTNLDLAISKYAAVLLAQGRILVCPAESVWAVLTRAFLIYLDLKHNAFALNIYVRMPLGRYRMHEYLITFKSYACLTPKLNLIKSILFGVTLV